MIIEEDWEKIKSFVFLLKLKGFENSSNAGLIEKTVKMNDCWETPGFFIGPSIALIRSANLKLDLSKTHAQHVSHSKDIRVRKLLEQLLSPKPKSRPNEDYVFTKDCV